MQDAGELEKVAPRKDFFVSYTAVDEAWAEWIAWCLEDDGYSVDLQKWDCRPGHNFALFMSRSTSAVRTIVVLSKALLEASYPQPEWAAAFADDPEGKLRKLIPVRVEACSLTGLLKPIVYIDFVGVGQKEAADRLLSGIRDERGKPLQPPTFPGIQSRPYCPACRQPIERN